MRALLSSIGTRGDVQPLAVLAAALQRAGHDVVLAIPPDASPIARALDVPHVACGCDVTAWLAKLDTATMSPLALIREFRWLLDHDLQQQAPVLLEAARAGHGVDVVVTGGLQFLGSAIADRVGAASAYVCFGPNLPRADRLGADDGESDEQRLVGAEAIEVNARLSSSEALPQ